MVIVDVRLSVMIVIIIEGVVTVMDLVMMTVTLPEIVTEIVTL